MDSIETRERFYLNCARKKNILASNAELHCPSECKSLPAIAAECLRSRSPDFPDAIALRHTLDIRRSIISFNVHHELAVGRYLSKRAAAGAPTALAFFADARATRNVQRGAL